MNTEQFKRARHLDIHRGRIEAELKIWHEELTHPNKMGYQMGRNNNHPVKLMSLISNELFLKFRADAIYELNQQMKALDREFEQL